MRFPTPAGLVTRVGPRAVAFDDVGGKGRRVVLELEWMRASSPRGSRVRALIHESSCRKDHCERKTVEAGRQEQLTMIDGARIDFVCAAAELPHLKWRPPHG